MGANAELLLAGYAAWNRDDCAGWLELLHPDVELSTSGLFPDLAPVYLGHDHAAKFWRQLHEPWEAFRIEVEKIEEDGDQVMATIRFRATGVDSGVEVDMRFGQAMTVRDGVATEFVTRRTAKEAREALPQKRRASA
ncbi:MAG: nuclear transport factor 2 family protein [Thermoleophilaceae bacterium]|nr:nuclear transport factor 2 family protein [Thermoleophilaceae bacterium]